MPKGQSHTTWFSELKDILNEQWKDNLSIQQHIELLKTLNINLAKIREQLKVKPPVIWCNNCNAKHEGRLGMVTMTAMYFALERFEICSHEKHLELKRNWKKYSKENSTDIYGQTFIEIKSQKHNNSCI